ncbi:MAG: YifB family Mg chelatase-like AAA ATPase [Propionibacteriaceae bacterium]
MIVGKARSVALVGLEGTVIEVEAAIGGGLPRTVLVGLPDTSLNEARERCKAAVASTGLEWPKQLVTVNLTPATLPKPGSHYDLGITAAVLAAGEQIATDLLEDTVLMGELGLDGRVRRCRGVLPALLAAVKAGYTRAVVPAEQVSEALLVGGLTIWGVASLAELVEVLKGNPVLDRRLPPAEPRPTPEDPDLRDVVGHAEARWVLEVAAAGRHHLFLHGAPGVGKTMLAERLPSILPDLTPAQALEVTAIHSLAGANVGGGLIRRPPYSAPHHTASLISLVGGGPKASQPGSLSLSHYGVLFLDEATEFAPSLIEALRTPLESGSIHIGRSGAQVRYPARFQLVLSANPCPCGGYGVASRQCTCRPDVVRRYQSRLSGPILDRIDLHHHVRPLTKSLLKSQSPGEASADVAVRVAEARERQARRLGGTRWATNGEVSGPWLRRQLPLPDGLGIVDDAVRQGRLSARGVDKVLRVAWTLADLAGVDRPTASHLRTALALRRGEELGAVA